MEIAIDLGKRRSYIVMEDNGKVVKEGYVETTKESFVDFFGEVDNPKVIVEASSTTNWVANMFEGYDITVAHPAKVRLIAQSVKKTDKTTHIRSWTCTRRTTCPNLTFLLGM